MFVFFQVWLCVIGSTAIFIFVTTLFIKFEKRNTKGKFNPQQSTSAILYLQLEYVLTIIASQGKQYKIILVKNKIFTTFHGTWKLCSFNLNFITFFFFTYFRKHSSIQYPNFFQNYCRNLASPYVSPHPRLLWRLDFFTQRPQTRTDCKYFGRSCERWTIENYA